MAGSDFPQRKTFPQGAGSSATVIDEPPPSPVNAQVSPSPTGMPSFSEMAQPFTPGSPGRAVSPEILMGIMSGAETIYGMLDSMAGIVPDLAPQFALQKDLLQRTMAALMVKGGTQASPNSIGVGSYPGGGFDRGSM